MSVWCSLSNGQSLLRDKLAVSTLEEFGPGSRFKRIYPEVHAEEEGLVGDAAIRKLVLCSGKLYYELLSKRREAGVKDVAIVRIEQLSPFPFDSVAAQVHPPPLDKDKAPTTATGATLHPSPFTATHPSRLLAPPFTLHGYSPATHPSRLLTGYSPFTATGGATLHPSPPFGLCRSAAKRVVMYLYKPDPLFGISLAPSPGLMASRADLSSSTAW
jgi:hypothetical protein